MPSAGHLKHETRLGPIQPSLTFSSMALVEPSTTLGMFFKAQPTVQGAAVLGKVGVVKIMGRKYLEK